MASRQWLAHVEHSDTAAAVGSDARCSGTTRGPLHSQNNLVTFVPERLNELELACGGRQPRIRIESQGNEVLRGLDESVLVTQ